MVVVPWVEGVVWSVAVNVTGAHAGPFQRTEMAGWHSAGFFTHNLLVKRGADTSFIQLGETFSSCCYHFLLCWAD